MTGAYLGQEVDVCALCDQQTGDILISVVGSNVQWGEPTFGRHVRVVIALQLTKMTTKAVFSSLMTGRWNKGKGELDPVGMFYLEEKSCGFAIVFLGGNVQGRQSNFASRVVFQQDGHDLVVSLLQGHGERSESVLCGQTLVGSVGQQEADDSVVILLGRHVERSESILRLDVDGSALEHQDLDHFLLSGCEFKFF